MGKENWRNIEIYLKVRGRVCARTGENVVSYHNQPSLASINKIIRRYMKLHNKGALCVENIKIF